MEEETTKKVNKAGRRKKIKVVDIIDESNLITLSSSEDPNKIFTCNAYVKNICNIKDSCVLNVKNIAFTNNEKTTINTVELVEFISKYLSARIFVENNLSDPIPCMTNLFEQIININIKIIIEDYINKNVTEFIDSNSHQKNIAKLFLPLYAQAQELNISLLSHDLNIYLACLTFSKGLYDYSIFQAAGNNNSYDSL